MPVIVLYTTYSVLYRLVGRLGFSSNFSNFSYSTVASTGKCSYSTSFSISQNANFDKIVAETFDKFGQ